MYSKFITFLLTALFCFSMQAKQISIEAKQVYKAVEVEQITSKDWSQYDNLNNKFKNFTIVEIETETLYAKVKNQAGEIDLTFKVDELLNWDIATQVHSIFAPNFQQTRQISASQKKSIYEKPDLISLRGYTNLSNQLSTFTLSGKKMMGRIVAEEKAYSIEPLKHHLKTASANEYLIYEDTDFIEMDHPEICGYQENAKHLDLINDDKQASKTKVIECTEIAVAYDQAFKNLYGSVDDANFMISARANNVAAFYIDEFEIDFKLTEIYETGFNEVTSEFNYSPCNWTDGQCTDGSILYDFFQWGEGVVTAGSGFNTNPDLGTYFTGRGVTQNFGYSFTFGVCEAGGYNWVEENNGFSEARKINLWIHEIGHTFGAAHSTSNNPSNMMSLIIPTSAFINVQNVTYNVITGHKNSRTCLTNGLCDDSDPPVMNQSDVFTLYPFLNDFVDQGNCNGTNIDVYNFGSYAFAIIEVNNQINMYASYGDGVFCSGSQCLQTYNLVTPSQSWACGDTNAPTCNDGIRNGSETGVDCGGSCPSCPATCSDGIRNGNETGVDCGGSCPSCGPTCNDGVKNGGETGVDCGGSCPSCPATCNDGIKNGNETGVDCGGSCPACPATCNDGIKNGNETGVDCGGSCPACPTGNQPVIFADYPFLNNFSDYNNCNGTSIEVYDFGNYVFTLIETNAGIKMYSDFYDGVYCSGSNCGNSFNLNNPDATWTCGMVNPTPTCNDGIQNGNETGIDCGGSACSPCAPPGEEPTIFAAYPFLNNFVDYNNCNGTIIEVFDFGSYALTLIETNAGIKMYSDYYDGVFCSGSACASQYGLINPDQSYTCGAGNPTSPTCTDGIKNGNETGIDCGGSACSPCSSGGVPGIFTAYPFLNDFVDYTNCNETGIEVYDFGNYAFTLIETGTGVTMYTDFYDGAYCYGYNCANVYGLNNPDASWVCGQPINKAQFSQNDLTDAFSINIFPNPATEKITVGFNASMFKTSNWKIVNHLGKTIIEGNSLDLTNSIDIEVCTDGLYYMMIFDVTGKALQQSFVVMRR